MRSLTTTKIRKALRPASAFLILALIDAPASATVYEFNSDGDLALIDGKPLSEPPSPKAPSVVSASGVSWRELADKAARRHGIPRDLFRRLVNQESRWNTRALSPKGAYGLTQLMPGTARQLGVDRMDPAQNLEGGARYLALQYRRFGSWKLALGAYNAGPRRVEKYQGLPPFKETQNYVRIILRDEDQQNAAKPAKLAGVQQW